MSNPIVLQVIAKSSPAPYAPLALAYYLQSLPANSESSIQVEFVHSLPEGASVALNANGSTTLGVDAVTKSLASLFPNARLQGLNSNEQSQIVEIFSLFPQGSPNFGTATAFLAKLEQKLTLRTFLVGHDLSLADIAVWGAIRANSIARAQLGQTVHTTRWNNYLSALPFTKKCEDEILAQSKVKAVKVKEEKKKDISEMKGNATFDLGLPNAKEGQVVTRFPPEPSGYLHIGHAKAAILNQYFAKLYKGKFLVRFDDTNPSKEKAEFEQSIIEDLALLGIKGATTTYTSDYFDQIHDLCIKMIELGKAYADDTELEKMRQERMDGVASARRNASVEENLSHFKEMIDGTTTQWCIRAKMSVDNPNKALRDPVMFRTNHIPHHRTGTKWKAYPTYDFACPIVDCLEGVTHALRTNEYRDRNPQYQWMLDALSLRKVDIWDYGRINFTYTLLSKRKLKWFVDEGYVNGWDDPRFPTVRGVRRRGLTIEGLTEYMLLQGPSQAVTNLEWDVIWNLNKKVIDPVAPRFVALDEKNLVQCKVSGPDTPESVILKDMPKHKKNPDVGTKSTVYSNVIYVEQADAITFDKDEELTLMDWGNAFVREITKNSEGVITSIAFELNLTGDFKKTKKKITWLGGSAEHPFTKVTLLDYDYLITKKKIEEGEDVKDFLTPTTEFKNEAVADLNVAKLEAGTILQFERKGYYIIDKVAKDGKDGRVEAILIPDGKAASIASKHELANKK